MSKVRTDPKTGLIRAYANAELDWRTVFSEFFDNSLDASAQTIRVGIGPLVDGCPKWISIGDDGYGCASPQLIVTLGDREDHDTTKMGRYGIGAKDGLLWAGGQRSIVRIVTVHNGTKYTLVNDWDAIARSGNWEADCGDESTDAPPGTSITIEGVQRRFPEGKALAKLIAEIGYTFAPAIKRGKQILFVRKRAGKDEVTPVVRWEPPANVIEKVSTTIRVGSRTAKVFVGMLAPGADNPKPGITYWNEFRVIKPASGDGCGGLDTSRITGFVELVGNWPLTKNKNGFAKGEAELYDAVFAACESLLRKAANESRDLRIDALRGAVERELNGMVFGDAEPNEKAVREPGDGAGAKIPTGNGGKHKRAKRVQPGRTFGGRKFTSLSIGFYSAGEHVPHAVFDRGGGRVLLNTSNSWVARAQSEQNAMVMVDIALHVLASEEALISKQMNLPITGNTASERIGQIVGHMTSRAVSLDGVAVNAAGGAAE